MRCDLAQRTCVESAPGQATCGACKPGFLQTPEATCRALKTCADVSCMPGFACVELTGADAECRMTGCASDEVPSADARGCVRCTIDCAGRPGATGRVFPVAATRAGACVCETAAGSFWDETGPGGGEVRPCDADGDGWVRKTALPALASTDPAIRDNARCTVRTVAAVRLVNDEGASRVVPMSRPTQLIEAETIDDPQRLVDAIVAGTLALPQGRPFRAEELNTLTKACVWKATRAQRADFNQNGVEDVDEAHDDPRLDDTDDPLTPLYDFAYFIELNRGWFEPPPASAPPGAAGTYVIQERARAARPADPTLAVPLGMAMSDGADYWRQCTRRRDAAYLEGQPGHDFGRFEAEGSWTGMGHASQFRCLRIVSQPTGRAHEATPGQVAAEWTLSQCVAAETRGPAAGVDATNPSEAAFGCTLAATPDPRSSTTAPVLLAGAKYLPYDDEFTVVPTRPRYVRGCVNECRERPFLCPGYDPVDAGAQCAGAAGDFGRLECGCVRGFGGPACELACAGDLATSSEGVGSLFTSADFQPAPRAGVWMCGASTNGGSAPLLGRVAGSTRTWGLVGDVGTPSTIPVVEACASDGAGGCTYRLRASAL